MSLILESDILHHILRYVDLKTICDIFCVNKIIENLCYAKHFWKEKIKVDYKNIVPQCDDWLWEYKRIFFVHAQTIKFVNHFIKMVKQSASVQHVVSFYNLRIRNEVTGSNLYWVPKSLLSQLTKYTESAIILSVEPESIFNLDMIRFQVLFDTHLTYPPNVQWPLCVSMSMNEFINYITKLHYDYGNFMVRDHNLNSFMFSNYK